MPTARMPVNISWSGASGSPGVNVWHGRSVADVSADLDFAALSGAVEDFYGALGSLIPAAVTFSFDGTWEGVGDDTGTIWTGTGWSVTGAQTGEFMPPADCLLVSWRAATGGRRGRGRTFVGPLHESCLQDNGSPEEAKRETLQGAADALIEFSDTFANGAMGVFSRVDNTFRDFITADVPNYFAVLRSRRD